MKLQTNSVFTLPNGLRCVHCPDKSEVSHVGIIIKTGSRDEYPNENGLAHFIEHAFFKGTTKHSSAWVLNRLDSIGGELNAYTTKEETVIYASFLTKYIERAVELITDILLNGSFPEKELVKEKAVIADEIKMYRDNPQEDIADNFDSLLFPEHPLGSPILGTEESLQKFDASMIRAFISRNYSTREMVLSYVGAVSCKRFSMLVEKYFEKATFNGNGIQHRSNPVQQALMFKQENRNLNQTHCIIGKRSYSMGHPRRVAFTLLNNILGGPAMNSRLNLNIREKYGYCYAIDSSYHAFTDTGLFSVYFGTDTANYKRTKDLVLKEFERFTSNPLTQKQLNSAKTQWIGQLALSRQNGQNKMLANAKSLLLFNEPDPLAKTLKHIERLTLDDINQTATEFFNTSDFTELVYH